MSSSDLLPTPATPQPVRVLQVLDKLGIDGATIHGVTRAVLDWIPEFDPAQFQFTICSLRAPDASDAIVQEAGLRVVYLNKGKFDPTTLFSLLRLIRQERPHVLHLHGFGASTFGRLASLLTGTPNIVHEHAVFPGQPAYQIMADALLSPLTHRAVAVSETVRQYMIEDRKIRPELLQVFHPGTRLRDFQPPGPETLQATRDEFGLRPDAPVICFVGRLAPEKGVTYLLEAFTRLLPAVPDAWLLLVGDGPDHDRLAQMAQQCGVADRVIFTGYRSDVLALIGISQVMAIPSFPQASFAEGGPTTFLEAMKMRVPVVGTPVGLMAEGIRDGETGLLVTAASAELLAEKLLYLLQNPDEARAMGQRSWEVCQQYSLENTVARLSELYTTLAASTGTT